jgi:precorrin-6Y C5,15-methyltransferase (decarboxylating)
VFLGGGLSEAAFEAAWRALKPGGRLVANAVTLEGQEVLLALQARHGGELCRIAVSRAEPVGEPHQVMVTGRLIGVDWVTPW